jgi:hypothetical protein
MAKKSGNKNHIAGKNVSGSHTSVIDGVAKVINKFATKDWFISVRAGIITTGKKVGGGVPFISAKRHSNILQKNTLTLTFKRSGVIQKIYVQVNDLEKNQEQILSDISSIISDLWGGAELKDRL